jgi:hypothetical protein
MSVPLGLESPKLTAATSGFVLAAAITVVLNTALAWAKDLHPALNDYMKSLSGHHWTTHGLADLLVFVVLGLAFTTTGLGQKLSPSRLIAILIGAVVISAVGLGLWYVLF